METQNILETGIGTKEMESLKAATVKIIDIVVEEVPMFKKNKAVFKVVHPQAKEPISISSIRYLKKDKLTTTGTWVAMDEDNKLMKGSALALLISKSGADNLKGMVNMDLQTELDEKGYLAFRCY